MGGGGGHWQRALARAPAATCLAPPAAAAAIPTTAECPPLSMRPMEKAIIAHAASRPWNPYGGRRTWASGGSRHVARSTCMSMAPIFLKISPVMCVRGLSCPSCGRDDGTEVNCWMVARCLVSASIMRAASCGIAVRPPSAHRISTRRLRQPILQCQSCAI